MALQTGLQRLPAGAEAAGMTACLLPSSGADLRRLHAAPGGSGDDLSAAARRWLRRLPGGRRPLHLCRQHPRLANRIAWCWDDAEMTAQVLDDALADRRSDVALPGTAAARELARLRDYNEAQRSDWGGLGD